MGNLKRNLRTKRLYSAFLHLAVVMLAIQVVILSNQNRRMKEAAGGSAPDGLKIGDTLVLQGVSPVNSRLILDTTSARQLVFIFTTSCPFCKQTVPMWNKLAARLQRSIPIIAISLDSRDSTIEYVKGNNLSFAVAFPLDAGRFKKLNKIVGVPMTLVRENSGKVLRLWKGKLDSLKALEVERSTSAGGEGEN